MRHVYIVCARVHKECLRRLNDTSCVYRGGMFSGRLKYIIKNIPVVYIYLIIIIGMNVVDNLNSV